MYTHDVLQLLVNMLAMSVYANVDGSRRLTSQENK